MYFLPSARQRCPYLALSKTMSNLGLALGKIQGSSSPADKVEGGPILLGFHVILNWSAVWHPVQAAGDGPELK